MECPQWMDAHTSFEIVWEPNDALQQIISQLDLQQVYNKYAHVYICILYLYICIMYFYYFFDVMFLLGTI